jgi:hypothetical protein
MRVRIRRFSKLSHSKRGREVQIVVHRRGFAALKVSVSASPSSEPIKLNQKVDWRRSAAYEFGVFTFHSYGLGLPHSREYYALG